MMKVVQLSAVQVGQVRVLTDLCQKQDGYSMAARLDIGRMATRPEDSVSDVLWYEQGQLVGFAGVNSYGDLSEVEAAILVHPAFRGRGIGHAVARAVERECQMSGICRLLVVVPHESTAGAALAAAMGARHAYSECTMDLDPARVLPLERVRDPVELRMSGEDDVPVMAAIVAAAFAEPVQEEEETLARLMRDPERVTYLATQDGRPVGVIQSAMDDGRAFIVHFAVRPDMQGRGIGRQMLLAIVHGLLNSGRTRITIEVETENAGALALYQRCGFVTIGVTNYELLELPRIPRAPELLFDR